MNKQLIEQLILESEKQESNAHGGNKKCFLFDDYALLKQKFSTDEILKMMQLTEELEKKGINVARTLDFKAINQNIQDWKSDKNVLVSEGYVLQQRAKGTPLLDHTNWINENKRYQIDYLKQIDSISKENQDFFNHFVNSWLKIQEAGLQIDPSKPGNFIYEQGKKITFIDLDLSNQKPNISTTIYEQLAVILNLNAYYQCYPEVQQAVQGRLNIIAEKYKNAILEQGIDISAFNQVVKSNIPEAIFQHNEQIEETPEEEISRLEEIIIDHISEERSKEEEIKRLADERAEKQRIEKEKRETEIKKLEEEDEQKNGKKRHDSKMHALLNTLIKKGIIPKNEATIYEQIFQSKRNIYLDLNPQLFKKTYMTASLDSVLSDLDNSNITIDMREMQLQSDFEISDQTYTTIRTSVDTYFKQYFENTASNLDTKLSKYSEMKQKQKDGLLSEEDYVNFILLEAELSEFSKGKELFPILGIDNEQTLKASDKVFRYLQEKNKISEEEQAEIENNRRQTDREFLHEVFKGTGITDSAKLRELYESQEELSVSEEDLEAVLSMFSGKNTPPSKLEKQDFKQVAENSIGEISLTFKALQLAKQDSEKSDDITKQGEQILW